MDGSDEARSILEAKLSKAEVNIAYWSAQCQEYQYMWAECASRQDEIMVQEGYHESNKNLDIEQRVANSLRDQLSKHVSVSDFDSKEVVVDKRGLPSDFSSASSSSKKSR